MVNVEEGPIAAPLPPPVRFIVTIQSCKWSDNLVAIVYHCACSNLVHIQVYRNGSIFKYAKPMNASVEKQYPTVTVTWDGGRVDIQSTCDCNAGCRFTRGNGGSGILQVTA